MNAYERRIVHQALKTDPDIETHSVEVDGSDKKVILLRPRRNQPAAS
jgi:predicted RNA-binding protein Jag